VRSPDLDADAVIALGQLALRFGRVNRITFHEDGVTPESDTDHTVMLGLVACAFAAKWLPHLDVGLIAQYATVHDLVEVYAGDTATLRPLSADAKAAKEAREQAAFTRIRQEFGRVFPWLPTRIAEYEKRATLEARYVKAIDKLLPKITHLLNDMTTVRAEGMSPQDLARRYAMQLDEIRVYAFGMEPVFKLRAQLVRRVLERFEAVTTNA